MERTLFSRIGIPMLALCAALPAAADTRFQVRQMTRDDVPPGKGQCDIRLQVDNEAEVTLRRNTVFIHTIAGRDPRDDGSECNATLPEREIAGFNFEVKDSRNEIRMVEGPSPRNDFGVRVLIRDTAGGEGRYHFRVSWDVRAVDFRREEPPPPNRSMPGFGWSRVVQYHGEGRGLATVNGFEQRLSNANVDIDRRGHVTVSFRADRGRELVFSGDIVGREGDRWRADVTSQDGRYRGRLFMRLDNRDQEVENVSIEAGDDRDRLRVNWDANRR
jgi:hypothetical protein